MDQAIASRPSRLKALHDALATRILVLDGPWARWCSATGSRRPSTAGAFPRLRPRPARQQRPAHAHPPAGDPRDPRPVPRGRRRHPRDQHLQLDLHLAGRLPPRADRGGAEPRGRAPRPRRGRRVHGEDAREAALRGGRAGPDEPHALALAGRERPRLPGGELRPGEGRLPRGGRGARRGRGRHPAGRDDLRHAERQGGALRHRRVLRAIRRAPADHDLGDDHRRLGPHAFGPDAGGVLEFRPPREAAFHRLQLRAGRQAAAAARGGARPHRRHARLAHPNAGLPNAMAEYDELPEETAAFIREWAEAGWLNITGGCCGTTPDHIRAIADIVSPCRPRATRGSSRSCASRASSRRTSARDPSS